MTNINLINAMGRIAPELIADAAPDAAQKEPTHKAWEKCVSVVVAACLCLMIAGAAYYFAGNSGNEPSVIYPGYTEESSFYYKGDIFENGFAIITHDTLTVAFRGWRSDSPETVVNDLADLVLYVDGKKAGAIPASPGKYEVKIDYSQFALKCDELDPYMFVSGVGYFCLNSEGYKINGDVDPSDLTE